MKKETPFAGGRWTEAKYRQFVRSALRKAWMRWPVKQDVLVAARRDASVLVAARRDAIGRSKQTKWEYLCSNCNKWFLGREVQVHHIEEAGDMSDMNKFIGTLFCEEDNLKVVCIGCHRLETEAKKRKAK